MEVVRLGVLEEVHVHACDVGGQPVEEGDSGGGIQRFLGEVGAAQM
ncbi:hypothetical protein [Streptomyces violaceusniger]